jgi:NAD(P)-dependent dehydrogenase (short-subunit alcohol dehydrogenase family)
MIKNYKKKFDLKNKLAFVAGGLGYIGKEIVKALVSMDCKVVVLDNFSYKTKSNNKNIHNEYIDLSKTSKLEKSFFKIIKKYGMADIFINASYPKSKDWKRNSFKQISLKSFETNIKIHLNSYIWCSKIIAEHMVKNKINGSIINLSSIYGLVGQDLEIYKGTDMKDNMTYSVVKGGINNFTKQMSSYYGKFNIRVNAICPGGVINVEDKKKLKVQKLFEKNYIKKVPLKRFARTDEIASTIIFLSSDASSYITGILLPVDGGWTAI